VRYVAFGLQLSSAFALPGMLERDDEELPCLALDILTRSMLEEHWHSAGEEAIWEGSLGDGRTLLVKRSSHGEHLFSYGREALFRLDAAGEHLACAPSEDGIAWQRVLLTKVLANVSLIRGYEALHASAVESPEGAVVVLAPSGTGKTALALALACAGWPLLSDDIVALGWGPAGVLAYPGTPHVNADRQTVRGTGTRRLAAVLDVLGQELWLAAHSITVSPCPVRAVCLLQRGPSLSLAVEPMPASPVALMPYMLGLADEEGRERERFELYSELMASSMLVRICAGERHPPEMIAQRLRALLAGAGAVGEPAGALA
jgi:hypothetical protein